MKNNHGFCGCRPPQHPLQIGEIKYSAQQINDLLDMIPKKADRKEILGLKAGFAPDEEDLTAVEVETSAVVKFKDRDTTKGKGYIILRTDKPIAEQMKQENTIYEIRYDFDLGGGTLEVPANCVLDFNGGNFRDGTLTGNKTSLLSSNTTIFGDNLIIDGTWNTTEVYPEWFGVKGENDAPIITKAIALSKIAGCCVKLNGTYNIKEQISISWMASIEGNKASINTNLSSGYAFKLTGERVYIRDLFLYGNSSHNAFYCLNLIDSNIENVLVKDYNIGLYTESSWCDTLTNVRIQGCQKPLFSASQSNNILYNRCSFVSYNVPIELVNSEELTFNVCEIANVSCDRAATFYNTQANFIGCYYENISNLLFSIYDTTYLSKINIIGGVTTKENLRINYGQNDPLINVQGFTKLNFDRIILEADPTTGIAHYYTDKSKLQHNYNPKIISGFDGRQPFPFAQFGGGEAMTATYASRNSKIVHLPTQYTGFTIADNLKEGELYTLIYKIRRKTSGGVIALRHGTDAGNDSTLIVQSSDGYIERRYHSFYAKSTALRILCGQIDLEIEELYLVEGNNTAISINRDGFLNNGVPDGTFWQNGDCCFDTLTKKPMYYYYGNWVYADGTNV